MNVLIDHHHYELALSLVLLLNRLNVNVYIPCASILRELDIYGHGYTSFNMQKKFSPVNINIYDGSQNIDLCISSVPHNYPIFKKICNKTIQQIGNHEWTLLNFDYILTSDLFSLMRFKRSGKSKICYYYPEIDTQKYNPKFIENRNIRSYIVNIKEPYGFTQCKSCEVVHETEYPQYSIFETCKNKLKINNIKLSHDYIEHMNIAEAMNNSRLTWHYKTIEGYGFSAICSLFCGTPVLTNPKWLAGTTLQSLCIPFKTSLYTEYNVKDIVKTCRQFIDETNHKDVQEKCSTLIRNLINFDEEADKVKRFIECVI